MLMFKFLPAKPVMDASHQAHTEIAHNNRLRQSPALLAATFTGLLLLTGCQQQSDTQSAAEDSQTLEQTGSADSKPMPPSDSAAAHIKQLQSIYVVQMQGLQRRLQAEYESLQAADAAESEDALLLNDAATTDTNSETVPAPRADTEEGIEADINTSTEVGERDLTVLKRISLEPRKPIILTEDQIIERYQQATGALYQPVVTPLSTEDIDTLLNIATLVPELFEHAEIAGRLSAKSPALARLMVQHQVWEQIQAQQVSDMQQMKLNQQQEFETLMAKFNETIKGYDEQIAKYEQTLKEFQ